MSQVKLTLRPPPNVDFVHGYPGITPGADRPQAAVKGAIEVRVGPQGVKAKWVRISLRKVETLPGGGATNTFFDFVGPSPINLWQASDEYAILQTQDFPFYIRIPEAIPPSIALEKGAGIKYELFATVCTLGKKGLMRSRKSLIVSTMALIVIDKHDLHSTWPVYCQPESRHLAQEGVNLIVERGNTCYGPGDRVSVMATIRSDSLSTVILRGFEFTLKETTVYRTGPYTTGKKSAPQVKVTVLGEQKVPVNATLYGGTQHKAELACMIPPNHTTTSLNSARHIDITYILNVKALMGTGTHLIMDLPVVVSNWPRSVSIDAIRRIGPAPSLSLIPPNLTQAIVPTPAPVQPQAVDTHSPPQDQYLQQPDSDYGFPRSTSAKAYATAPVGKSNGYPAGSTKADEFGGYGHGAAASTINSPYSRPESQLPSTVTSSTPGTRRPNSRGNSTNPTNRFTIANIADEPDISPEPSPVQPKTIGTARTPWLTAEEEKKRLYEQARAEAEKVQASAAIEDSYVQPSDTHVDAGPLNKGLSQSNATPTRSTPWPTAEDEKTRLFEQAKAIAAKTQTFGSSYSPSRSESVDTPTQNFGYGAASGSSGGVRASQGAALYQQALSSMVKPAASQANAHPSQGNTPHRSQSAQAVPVAQYPSAEDEKIALKRYQEAKQAVDRTQKPYFDDPKPSPTRSGSLIPYDSLYPTGSGSGSGSGSQSKPASSSPASDLPPSFGASVAPSPNPVLSALSEKERLRKAYEAADAVALARKQDSVPAYDSPAPYTSSPSSSPPPFASASGSSSPLSEKEQLRRKYEAEDKSNGIPDSQPLGRVQSQTRPASGTPVGGRPAQRSIPVPPVRAGSSMPLSAADEKALLRARYETEDRATLSNGSSSPSQPSPSSPSTSVSSAPPAPPPLAPRPPMDYIKETQEEDARVSRFVSNPTSSKNYPGFNLQEGHESPSYDGGSSRPDSIAEEYPGIFNAPGPPPPLPPKVGIDQ